jgi:hypothetical protein
MNYLINKILYSKSELLNQHQKNKSYDKKNNIF